MSPQQKAALITLLEQLSATDLEAVTRFAEFLLSRGDAPQTGAGIAAGPAAGPRDVPEPQPIERPENEKVVAAVRRLSQTYYMLDKKEMLGATSDLVTQHILHGREAEPVIDELERLFEQRYRRLTGAGEDD